MMLSARSALTVLVTLAATSLAHAQAPFSLLGGGATIPASGTGGGNWPSTPPAFPGVSNTNTPSPEDGCRFTSLQIYGFMHTFVGDLQIVLRSPSGRRYDLVHRPGFTGTNLGNSGDVIDGVFTLVSSELTSYPTAPAFGDWTSGTYRQSYAVGASAGSPAINGVENVPLSEIGVETGVWSLMVYDWASGDVGSFDSWRLHGVRGIPVTFHGPGSAIPAAGSGDGVWPWTLPSSPAMSSSMYAPVGLQKISRVVVENLTHSYVGDLHIVLRQPNSFFAVNLIHRLGFTGSGTGSTGDCNGGEYIIVPPNTVNASAPPLSGPWNVGRWWQHYGTGGGAWPHAGNSIHNYPIDSIRPEFDGKWRLEIYDWAAGDTGAFAGWRIEGYYLPTGPLSYCTSGTSTNGCTPWMLSNGTPSSTFSSPCSVSVVGVEGQKSGMIFYGVNGKTNLPWGSGFFCVKAPTQRTPVQNSGGAANSCQGVLTLDWNQFQLNNPQALGQPFTAGETVFIQGWYRDPPSPLSTNFSNALVLTHL